LRGAGADVVEVAQGGVCPVQGVVGAADAGEHDGDVVAGLPGAVGLSAGLEVADGLLVVGQRGAQVPAVGVDDTELVVGGGAVGDVVFGVQVQGLVVAAEGVGEVPSQGGFVGARLPRTVRSRPRRGR
jgi:hypothetical protein